MDQETKDILEGILKMDKESLSEEQKSFLLARRSYLNDEQRKRYADLIEAHEAAVEAAEEAAGDEDEKPKKRGGKKSE